MQRIFSLLLVLGTAVPAAHALTLDFGEGPTAPTICTADAGGTGALQSCNNYGYISQSHGDVAGVVDVSYLAPRVLSTPTSLYWWNSGYNNLYGVLFAPTSDANSLARIELKPVPAGAGVLLTGFDLGAYPSTTLSTTVNVYALGGGAPLFTYSGPVGNGSAASTHFSVNVFSANGLWLEFQDSAWNVGIDHVAFSVTEVPEPTSAALLLAGLMGTAGVLRKRRG